MTQGEGTEGKMILPLSALIKLNIFISTIALSLNNDMAVFVTFLREINIYLNQCYEQWAYINIVKKL